MKEWTAKENNGEWITDRKDIEKKFINKHFPQKPKLLHKIASLVKGNGSLISREDMQQDSLYLWWLVGCQMTQVVV